MAEIPLILNAPLGLVDGFAGDADVITPAPERTVESEDGEMVSGLFNQHLRNGYLAPVTNTSTSLTLDTTPETKLTSAVHDSDNDRMFFADRGVNIYMGTTLSDTALEEVLELDGGDITDLEIYTVNDIRNLFYVYHEDDMFIESSATSSDSDPDWTQIGVRIDAAASTKPTIDVEVDWTGTSGAHTETITVPSGTNQAAVVFLAISGQAINTITWDAVAMTQVNSWTRRIDGNTWYLYVYSATGLGTGDDDLVITPAASAFMNFQAVVVKDADQTTPVGFSNMNNGVGDTPVVSITTADDALNLAYSFGPDNAFRISTAGTVDQSYDENAQTGNSGSGIAFNLDGSKMFLTGRPASTTFIYEYDLTTDWDLSTASYSTNSLDIESYGGSSSYIYFSPDGTKLFTKSSAGDDIYRFNLTTGFDLTTATYNSTVDISTLAATTYQNSYAMAFNRDGDKLYISERHSNNTPQYRIVEYNLSTAWDLSTLSRGNQVGTFDYFNSMQLVQDDAAIFVGVVNDATKYMYYFNPLSPGDIRNITLQSDTMTGESNTQSFMPQTGEYVFNRDPSNNDVQKYNLTDGALAAFTPKSGTTEVLRSDGVYPARQLVRAETSSRVNVGVAPIDDLTDKTEDWMFSTLGVNISTRGSHSFLVPTDNGFSYLFTGNAVHRVDGTVTGGLNGTVTKNVLLFPPTFTITDAVDFRSQLYMALHQYPVDSESVDLTNHTGKCGVVIWDKSTVELGGVTFIEIPGAREIKKIYASPDGVIKMLTISDSGLTQLRMFSYNDSGSVVFPVMKSLGIGAHPQFPDGHAIAGDKVVWLANDGYVYCEKGNAINILHEVKAPGATTALKQNNIESGVVFYGGDSETASSGLRSNKQSFVLSYNDSGITTEKIYPFDLTTGSNGSQTPHQGDAYTRVVYIPVTSRVTRVRVYNLPTENTGTDVIATVKLYFNQSTTASMPNGMTKSVTLKEARRGYVDFNISKSYVHAIQLEFEWATGTPIGTDMYLPSAAIISTEETDVKTPDTE